MANPLARIVMENIAKKSNIKDDLKKMEYDKREDLNKTGDLDLKSLDRLADELRGNKEDKSLQINKNKRSDGVGRKNNLSLEELSLISDLIAGDVDTRNTNRERESASSQRDLRADKSKEIRGLSLDKLAKNIKNSI